MPNSEKNPDAPTADDVGYCKPPKASQWKPGQSGNPAGKKKGDKSFKKLFLKMAAKKVVVSACGKKVPLLQAVITSAFHHGVNGDSKLALIAAKLLHEMSPPPNEVPEPVVGEVVKDGTDVYITEWLSDDEVEAIEALRDLKPTWEMELPTLV